MSIILAVDVGTTNVKASLVNKSGTLLKVARKPQTILREAERAAEHAPEQVFRNVIDTCKEALAGRESETSAISISVYQYGMLLLSKNMECLTNISTLLDTRARLTFESFKAENNLEELYRETGCPSFFQALMPRLDYFRKHSNDQLSKARHILSAKSWLLYKFTGELITEASTESASQLLDIKKVTWSEKILAKLGLSVNQFPEIVEPLGNGYKLLPEILKELNLPENVRIIPSVYDGGAICLGMNAYRTDTAVANIGTSGMLRMLSDTLVYDETGEMRLHPFYLINGKYLVGGAVNNASLPLRWIKENLLNLSYDELDRLARQSPLGSKNLFFMPFITGERDIKIGSVSSGVFFGLRDFHQQEDFVRSVLEGVSFSINSIKKGLVDSGLDIKQISIGGGGIRKADIWANILSNVLDLRLVRSLNEEACLIGNAILGFTYTGEFDSIESASAALTTPGEIIEPHKEIVDAYSKYYNFYSDLYDQLADIYFKHADFSRSTPKLCLT